MFQKVLSDAGFGDITTEIVEAGPSRRAVHSSTAANPNGYCGLGGTGLSCSVGVASAE
jgi:peptide-methionine (S)-S-oxide reductase